MAITNFIPSVWSETLIRALDKSYIGVAHCNRDFEGEIREKGNTVKVCGIQNVTVRDYVKNTDMSTADALNDFSTDLAIDHAKYFNFQIDDIDRVQNTPKLMELAIQNAANALADEADKAVYALCSKATLTYSNSEVLKETILDCILQARTKFYENNNAHNEDIVLEVSPALAERLMRAKISTLSDNTEAIENGCIGNIAGCKVYVSKNMDIGQKGFDFPHIALMRTKRAVAFAEQISEVQAYRPERRFADAVKGLHLYGCDIIYPNEFMTLSLQMMDY